MLNPNGCSLRKHYAQPTPKLHVWAAVMWLQNRAIDLLEHDGPMLAEGLLVLGSQMNILAANKMQTKVKSSWENHFNVKGKLKETNKQAK